MILKSFFIALIFILPELSFSQYISRIKGKRVLIELEGDHAKKGDYYFALDSYDKKKALIRILKVKNDQAIGTIRKGEVKLDWHLLRAKKRTYLGRIKAQGEKVDFQDNRPPREVAPSKQQTGHFFLGSLYWDFLDVSEKKIALQGYDYGAQLGFEYSQIFNAPLYAYFELSYLKTHFKEKPLFWEASESEEKSEDKLENEAKASALTEGVKEEGNCLLEELTPCYFNADFLGAQLVVRHFLKNHYFFNLWVGAGGGAYYPLKTHTSLLKESSLKYLIFLSFNLGGAIHFSKNSSVLIQAEYKKYLLKVISIQSLALQAGLSIRF